VLGRIDGRVCTEEQQERMTRIQKNDDGTNVKKKKRRLNDYDRGYNLNCRVGERGRD